MPLTRTQSMRARVLLQFIETGKWFDYGAAKVVIDKALVGARPSPVEWEAADREAQQMKRYAPDPNPANVVPTMPQGFDADDLRKELKEDLVILIDSWDPRCLVRKINELSIPYRLLPWSESASKNIGKFFGQLLRGEIKSPWAELIGLYKEVKGSRDEFVRRVKSDPSKVAMFNGLLDALSKSKDQTKPFGPAKFPKDWIIVRQAPVENFRSSIYLILGELLEEGFYKYLHKCQQCGILFLSKRVGPGVGKFCGSKCTTAWHNQMKLKDKSAWAQRTRSYRERVSSEIKQTLSILRSSPRTKWMNKLKRKFPKKTRRQLEMLLEKCQSKMEAVSQ